MKVKIGRTSLRYDSAEPPCQGAVCIKAPPNAQWEIDIESYDAFLITIKEDLIISSYDGSICIYDDYVE